ncbi:hypothetical protein J3D56_002361 [Erwinia persicina]|uniref:DUF943 family protein n=1 Tax=Erwinia persicina TaxID=55211 RepID=UPI0020A16670|nr:DUF943 family protein [Erwinia persicina]MCP1438925.1 hypothetical protein [Erwinia persicina]
MRVKKRSLIALLALAVCVLPGYWLWLSLRPVEVIAVHDNGNHSYVLVRNFPQTDMGKINWWLKNKDTLKEKYNIPNPSSSGYFTVIFWNFGEGYKEEGKYDRLCFDDMKIKINCIEKDAVFSVDKSRNFGMTFTAYDGDNYRLGQNGDIIKVGSD